MFQLYLSRKKNLNSKNENLNDKEINYFGTIELNYRIKYDKFIFDLNLIKNEF